MKLRILAAAAFLLADGVLARDGRAAASAGPEEVALAQRFVETPIASLPPEEVEAFLALDPATLPPPLRRPARAKRLALRALMRLTKSEEAACPRPGLEDGGDLAVVKLAGFAEVLRGEVGFLRKRTGLDEKELVCRSSLLILTGKSGRRYFVYPTDRLWTLVAGRRAEAAEAADDSNNPPAAATPEWRPDGYTTGGEGEGVRATVGMGCGCSGTTPWRNDRNGGCYRLERNCRSPWGGDPTEPCRLCP